RARAWRGRSSRHVRAPRRDRPRQARALLAQLPCPPADPVLAELEAAAAEGAGRADLAARVAVALVDPSHDVGVGVVPQLGTGAVREARREQHGAVAAVEDEDLARAHALADLPAARRHGDATLASTPTSVLALTTARVES